MSGKSKDRAQWTKAEEKNLFDGVLACGRSASNIREKYVPGKTTKQITNKLDSNRWKGFVDKRKLTLFDNLLTFHRGGE